MNTMKVMEAMQLAMKEIEMQELIRELIMYRSKHGLEEFKSKIQQMRDLIKEEQVISNDTNAKN